MGETISFQIAEFAPLLVDALSRAGVFAKLDFRIPGTRSTISDVYIASPVRAFVEIKCLSSPLPSEVQGLVHQMEQVRRQFGEDIVPVLIAVGEPQCSPPLIQELRDAGYFVLSLEKSTLSFWSASQCAREIQTFLINRPYRFAVIVPDKQDRLMIRLADLLQSLRGSTGIGSPHGAALDEPDPHRESQAGIRLAAMSVPCGTDRPFDFPLSMSETQASVVSPDSDVFFDLLVSLKSVLRPEHFEVLEEELSAFSEEYRHEHYTACALRIGRTLEHVVYELSRAWGVNVNRTALQILSDLDNSFEQLSRAVIDYATTDEDEKAGRQKSVFRQYQIVSSKLTRLVLDLDSDMRPRSADVPVNVELIVRDVRKQFVRRNKVSNAVDSIINENILTKIMDIRNDAEHASTSGERRELSKSEIDAAVELLRTALFRFCNVAFAIAEKER